MQFSTQFLISQKQTLRFSVQHSPALYEPWLPPSLTLLVLRCGVWKRTILSFEMMLNKLFSTFFKFDPSILHLFSSFNDIYIRCYRLKHSISIFHSSSYQLLHLLQPLKLLFRLLILQWRHPQHKCSRPLLEQLFIDELSLTGSLKQNANPKSNLVVDGKKHQPFHPTPHLPG